MAKVDKTTKAMEGLGILLMLMGVSLTNHDWGTLSPTSMVAIFLIIGGWLVYSFGN